MTREQRIDYLIEAIWEIEGVTVGRAYFEDYTDERIDNEIERYDYLLDK